jgi:phosphatidylglycerophosphatase C
MNPKRATENPPVEPAGPPTGARDPRPLVAFDFDRTLTRRDTMRLFLLTVSDWRTVTIAFLRHMPQLASALRGDSARNRAKELICFDILRGLTSKDAEDAAAKTAEAIQRSLMRADALIRLRWHQAQGHRIIVVSASFEAYVKLVATSLGIREVIATKWEVDPTKNVLTGRLDGVNVRGDAKVDLIANLIAGPCILEYAYGNSHGDAAMLARAKHPVWVGRRPIPGLGHTP